MSQNAGWSLLKAFAFLAVIECAARLVTGTVNASHGAAAATWSGLQTAIATTTIAAVLIANTRLARRVLRPRAFVIAGSSDIGRIR